ncbi:MBG domain-containing protein [Fulvivirga ligni]|uniref:MBG domain-containing protein n=1 Tax=Fulvivirga ligni TaxID=2904246 RepID=UPI001F3F3C79|nr:MBG domain-containing protein [Fulvivirga ligni]UII19185.1 MBG domain-containing protein [Fulvivirga ligni]
MKHIYLFSIKAGLLSVVLSLCAFSMTQGASFTSTPVTEAAIGEEYTYNITTEGLFWLFADIDLSGDLPNGLSFTDNGAGSAVISGVPTETGEFEITLHGSDINDDIEQTFTITVSKGNASIIFSDLNTTFNGSPQSVDVSTNPSGLNVTLTYNGQAQAPTNAGVYTVEATVVDDNYQGTASDNFTIEKANASIAIGNKNQTYNGLPREVNVTPTPADLSYSVTYDGNTSAPINVGVYSVHVTINDNNYQGDKTANLTINKGEADITLTNLIQYYDGTSKQAGYTTDPSGLSANLTYNGSTQLPVEVGTYNVMAEIADANYEGSASGVLQINKTQAQITLIGLEKVYNGEAQAVTYTTDPEGLDVNITYNGTGNVPTNAGVYTVYASIVSDDYSGSVTDELVIEKANASVTVTKLNQVFDGNPKPVSVVTAPTGLSYKATYNGSTTVPFNAGEYDVKVTVQNANYKGSFEGTLKVEKAPATVTINNLEYTYNGNPRGVNVTVSPTGLPFTVTYSGEQAKPVDAGEYEVKVTVNGSNYKGEKTATMVIKKAQAQITLADQEYTYTGEEREAVFSTSPGNLAVDLTYNGNTETPVNAGVYDVQATIAETNYVGSTSGKLTINKAEADISFSDLTVTYNGEPREVGITTSPEGLNVLVTYNGGENLPREVGSYNVLATIDEPNYVGSNTTTFVIKEPEGTNSKPVLTNIETDPIYYRQGDGKVIITNNLIINDFDNVYMKSAKLTIEGNYEAGVDKLVYNGENQELDISFNAQTGTMSIIGEDTRSNYENILRSIKYENTFFGETNYLTKRINITVNDGFNDSNEVTRDVEITALKDLGIVSAFTPNGDAVNNTWYVEHLDQYSSVQIKIYEKNGNEVYNCGGKECQWDGTYKGHELPVGTYFYTIDLDKGKRRFQGTVTILR